MKPGRLSPTDAWTALPLVLYLGITLPLAFILNVWKDDAYTLHSTASTLAYAFNQSITFEQNAPLYFLVMVLWRHLNESAVWARLFSVSCGAAVVLTVPPLVRRYLPGVPAYLVGLVVALSPPLIWAALEIRIYALVILFASLLMLAFYDAFIRNPYSRRATYLYGALCLLGTYTQFYLLFLIAAQGLIVLIYRRSALIRYLLVVLPVLLALLPMVGLIRAQAANLAGQFTPPTLHDSLQILARSVSEYFVPVSASKYRIVAFLIAAAALLPTAIALARSGQRQGQLMMPIMFACGFVLFAIVPYGVGAWIGSRHAISLLLPAIFTLFAAFTFVQAPVRTRVAAVWVCLVLCLECLSLFTTYRSLAKEGDWIRVTAFIHRHEKPNEPIFVFEAESALPFEYYYRGPNRVVAVPQAIDFKQYELRKFELHSSRQAAQIFAGVPSSGRAWLITSGACTAMNIHYGCGVLEQYVSTCCRTTLARTFYKATVRLLDVSGAHGRQASGPYVNSSQAATRRR